MLLFGAHRADVADPGRGHQQPDLRVAVAERARGGRTARRPRGRGSRRRRRRRPARSAPAARRRATAAASARKASRKASTDSGLDLEARGGAVAAAADQVPLAGAQPGEQVVAGDAAARAAAGLALERDQDDRLVVALGEPRGDDADDPRVPALPRDHQRRVARVVRLLIAERLLGPAQDLLLGIAALAVAAVELGGDLARPLLVGGQHQLDAGVGAVEPPGGVDPRAQPEGEVALVEPLRLDLGDLEQRPHPRAAGLAQDLEAGAHQGPVLAAQRDQVGDGRQRHQVEVAAGAVLPDQRRRELVGDAGRAEVGAGIAADDRMQDRALEGVRRAARGGR